MITDITAKLQRLLDGYLDQDIDKEVYRAEKSKLLFEKKSLEEEISRNQQKQKHWLEPPPPKQISARKRAKNPELAGENQWDALRASHQKVGLLSENRILECLYDFTRTYFMRNL